MMTRNNLLRIFFLHFERCMFLLSCPFRFGHLAGSLGNLWKGGNCITTQGTAGERPFTSIIFYILPLFWASSFDIRRTARSLSLVIYTAHSKICVFFSLNSGSYVPCPLLLCMLSDCGWCTPTRPAAAELCVDVSRHVQCLDTGALEYDHNKHDPSSAQLHFPPLFRC
jgi:hypothetical protein